MKPALMESLQRGPMFIKCARDKVIAQMTEPSQCGVHMLAVVLNINMIGLHVENCFHPG